jgi:hypothetical protein
LDAVDDTEKIVKEKMIHIHKMNGNVVGGSSMNGRLWPDEFRGQKIYIKVRKQNDKSGKVFDCEVTFETQTYKPRKKDGHLVPFISDQNPISLLAVVVVDVRALTSLQGTAGNNLHSLYAKNYNPKNRKFDCINSWGPNKNPKPQIGDQHVILVELIKMETKLIPDLSSKYRLFDPYHQNADKLVY